MTVLVGLRRGGSKLESLASDREGKEVVGRRGVLSVALLEVAMVGGSSVRLCVWTATGWPAEAGALQGEA